MVDFSHDEIRYTRLLMDALGHCPLELRLNVVACFCKVWIERPELIPLPPLNPTGDNF